MKRAGSTAAKLAVTLLCLGLLFWQVPLEAVLAEFATVDLGLLVLAYSLLFLARLCVATRMRVLALAQGLPLSLLKSYEIDLASNFYGLFLPGGSSSLAKLYKLARVDGSRGVESMSTLIADRVVDIGLTVSIGCAFVFIDLGGNSTVISPATAAIIVAGIAVAYVLLFTPAAHRPIKTVIAAAPLPTLVRSKATEFLESIRRFAGLSSGRLAAIMGLSLLREIIGATEVYLVALALGLPLDFATAVWLRALAAVLSLIPITISGLGLREGSFALLLVPFGIMPERSVSYSLLLFGGTILIGLTGGMVELVAMWRGQSAPSERTLT